MRENMLHREDTHRWSTIKSWFKIPVIRYKEINDKSFVLYKLLRGRPGTSIKTKDSNKLAVIYYSHNISNTLIVHSELSQVGFHLFKFN